MKFGLPKVKVAWFTSKPQLLSTILIHPSIINLFTYSPIVLPIDTPIHLPIYPSIYISIHPSIHPSNQPSSHLSIHVEICWYHLMNEHWVFQSHFWEPPDRLANEVKAREQWHGQNLNRRKIFLETKYEQRVLMTEKWVKFFYSLLMKLKLDFHLTWLNNIFLQHKARKLIIRIIFFSPIPKFQRFSECLGISPCEEGSARVVFTISFFICWGEGSVGDSLGPLVRVQSSELNSL